MKRLFFYIILFVSNALFLCGHTDYIANSQIDYDLPYAIINGKLIDGTGSEPVQDAVIVVENGLIKAVGSRDEVNISEITQFVDVDGAVILPGFFNCHVHRGYSISNLTEWARGGVTTVRDLGASLENFRNNRPLNINSHARLIAAGPGFTVPGGYPLVPWGSPVGYNVLSPQDAYAKVNQHINDGADIIKIFMESGDVFNRNIPRLSFEESSEIVKAAHERNTLVSSHVLSASDLEVSIDIGVDDIAHMIIDDLSDDLIRRMIDNGIYWVPTLELWNGVGNGNDLRAIANLRKFVSAGGMVAVGTDYAGYNSTFDLGMPIRELEWMSEAGMSHMQIIVAATKNSAHVCGIENELGTLETGKIADILIVNGDPLINLRVFMDIRMVIHGGEIIREE